MSMLERFRAPKNLELRDKDAGATPLRDDRKGKLKNGELKERERALTAELTAEVAKLQEELDRQGRAGWELVNVVHATPTVSSPTLIFKKEV